MLEKFRKIIQGWLGKVLITLLLLPFALFGVSSIFQVDPNKKTVVEINGVEIDERELLRAVEISKQNLIGRLGEQASSFVTNDMVRPAALENLISQELIRQSVEENSLDVSIDAIHQMIMEMEVFQIDGKFSQSHFEELLRRNGLRPEIFPQKMRDEFLQRQMNAGYQATSFSTLSEVRQLENLYNQTRSFSYTELQSDKVLNQIRVSDAQIQAYYDENKETFRTDEQLTIEYLTIDKSDFSDDLTASNEELQQRYEEKLVEMQESQERAASHILIEINDSREKKEAKKLIDSLFAELENGADFSSLAKKHSEDKGSSVKGGSLGFAGRGVYVDEFEEALFALQTDEISRPVLTEFGYHIIKLEGIQPEAQSFAFMKAQLIEEIKVSKADQPYQDALEELRGLSYESSDLAEPAAFLEKEIQISSKVSKNSVSSDDVMSNPSVIEAAFSAEVLENGNNSDVIELNDGRSVVLRLKDHFPSKVRPVEELKAEITAKLTQSLLKEKMEVLAEEIVASLKAGTSNEDVANLYKLEWTDVENIKRDDSAIPGDIVSELFKQPRPAENESYSSTFSLSNGQRVIAILSQVSSAEKTTVGDLMTESPENSQVEVEASDVQFNRLLENQKGALELQSYQSWLREEAEIKEL